MRGHAGLDLRFPRRDVHPRPPVRHAVPVCHPPRAASRTEAVAAAGGVVGPTPTPRRRGTIPNRLSIEQRPAIVEERSRIGDWEADTVIGKNHKQAIVSLVERKSGLTLIRKVGRRTADAVNRAMTQLLKPYQRRVHTIISGNGKEFAGHK
jgi:hypothetical protein